MKCKGHHVPSSIVIIFFLLLFFTFLKYITKAKQIIVYHLFLNARTVHFYHDAIILLVFFKEGTDLQSSNWAL